MQNCILTALLNISTLLIVNLQDELVNKCQQVIWLCLHFYMQPLLMPGASNIAAWQNSGISKSNTRCSLVSIHDAVDAGNSYSCVSQIITFGYVWMLVKDPFQIAI